MMNTKEEKLAQLLQAYESGALNKVLYEAAIKELEIKDTQAGVIGDNATVEGDIQHGDRMDIDAGGDAAVATGQAAAVIVKNIIPLNQPNPAEKIDNIAYDEKTGSNTLWNLLSRRKAEYEKSLEEINRIAGRDPLEIAQYYIEPDCQDVNPLDHAQQDFASKSLC
ncbi:MAG: hypothetical protein R2941_12790 [Desulfobacterales bacterium]